jgi:opacity protein-like surface antigen
MKTALAALVAIGLAMPAAAQRARPEPTVSLRAFAIGSHESFAAGKTFDAVFGRSSAPFWGGGVDLVMHHHYYIDVSASRLLAKNAVLTGHRVAVLNGQTYDLGIPLTASIASLEVEGGYRFTFWRRVLPYVGAGFGSYAYKETCQNDVTRPNLCEALVDPGGTPNVEARHAGLLLVGGAEVRLYRWISVGADVHFTRAPGILGVGGVSKEFGETNLGGRSARFKVLVGR